MVCDARIAGAVAWVMCALHMMGPRRPRGLKWTVKHATFLSCCRMSSMTRVQRATRPVLYRLVHRLSDALVALRRLRAKWPFHSAAVGNSRLGVQKRARRA